jgi:hypothetical protein
MSMSKAQVSSPEMSKADEFRQSTAEFWSKMDQKSKPVAERRKLTPTRSRKSPSGRTSTRAAAPAAKAKKRSKH